MNMVISFKHFLLNEGREVLLYHGTALSNLPSIVQKGFVPNSPMLWDNPSQINYRKNFNYLSPTMSRAIRYGVGPDGSVTPVVFELKLSSAKKQNRLRHDPMDREDDAWNYEYDGMDSPLSFLEDNIETFLKKYGISWWNMPDQIAFAVGEQGLGVLNGFNLYQFILKIIQQKIGQRFSTMRPQILRDIQDEFPQGKHSEDIHITNSGTLRIDSSYYQTLSQLQYPKVIGPGAIAAIWVQKAKFPDVEGEVTEVGRELLPHEARQELEGLQEFYMQINYNVESIAADLEKMSMYSRKTEQLTPEEAADELNDWVEQLKTWDNFVDDDDEVVHGLEALIQMLDDKVDKEKIREKAKEVAEIAQDYESYGQEQWGESPETKKESWVRVARNSPHFNQIVTNISYAGKKG